MYHQCNISIFDLEWMSIPVLVPFPRLHPIRCQSESLLQLHDGSCWPKGTRHRRTKWQAACYKTHVFSLIYQNIKIDRHPHDWTAPEGLSPGEGKLPISMQALAVNLIRDDKGYYPATIPIVINMINFQRFFFHA